MSSNPNESEPVALTKARAEVSTLTPEQRRVVTEVAGLWQAEWTTLEKLPPKDLEFCARMIISSFPDFGPMDVLRYFTILGGRFYETGEFWLHQAAQHPDYRGAELEAIRPDSDDWKEYLGDQDPAVIAAAVKCSGRRRQRGCPEPRIEVEAAYVTFTDPILSEYTWLNGLGTGSRGDAEKRVKELVAPGASHELIWKRNPGEWLAKVMTPRPDAIALAFKKARTSASRRCLRRLFSLAEARVSTVLATANQRLGDAVGRVDEREDEWCTMYGEDGKPVGRFRAGGSVARVPLTPTQDYNDARQTPREIPVGEAGSAIPRPSAAADDAVGAGAAAQFRQEQGLKAESTHDAAADRADKLIKEEDRRKLYTDLEAKDFSKYADDAHEALHALIAEMKGILPADPRASTRDLTYPEWMELRHRIDALPPVKNPTDANPEPFGKGGTT